MAGGARRLVGVSAACVALAFGGCGGDGDDSSTSTGAEPLAPSLDGRFAVGDDGRELALSCWGEGSPAVVIDAGSGSPGIAEFQDQPWVRRLATSTRVCMYDRAGLGASDPPPPRTRGLDDAVDDLRGLLEAADVSPPYVLVGSSGGGFNAYHYAGRHPGEVAGLVLLDVPPGHADLTAADVPAVDSPDNPERMDYLAIERQMALDRLPIPEIPVTVITASAGQSADPDEQKVWLDGSSDPVQVVLEGGHGISVDDPDGVLEQLRDIIERVESS